MPEHSMDTRAITQEHRSLVLRLESCRHYTASESCCRVESHGSQVEERSWRRILSIPTHSGRVSHELGTCASHI
jgi:hypothetical protein